jgi:hypothetical protein
VFSKGGLGGSRGPPAAGLVGFRWQKVANTVACSWKGESRASLPSLAPSRQTPTTFLAGADLDAFTAQFCVNGGHLANSQASRWRRSYSRRRLSPLSSIVLVPIDQLFLATSLAYRAACGRKLPSESRPQHKHQQDDGKYHA